jgi:DNA adenine methylase
MIEGSGLISRVGGKSRQKKEIFKRWLPTEYYNTYVEPFLGGGNIAMEAPVVKKMIAGDSDTNVINIFNDFKKIDPEVFRNFDFTRPSRKKWQQLKHDLPKEKDPIKRLYSNLYIRLFSFAGKGQNYIKTNGRYTKLKKNIEKYQDILNNFTIVKKDYKYLIKKYDSPKTFFYLDPPYYKVYSSAYETGEIDHQELFDLLDNIKGYFLLSYNDVPYIRKLYKDYYITKFISKQTVIDTGALNLVSELLISNYKINSV